MACEAEQTAADVALIAFNNADSDLIAAQAALATAQTAVTLQNQVVQNKTAVRQSALNNYLYKNQQLQACLLGGG